MPGRLARLFSALTRRRWMAGGLILLALGAIAFGVVVAGIVPIRASSGHWTVTEWFLHFAMRRAVVSQSLALAPQPPPGLDADHFVLRGAGHYETGCRPCHGVPGDAMPRIPRAMTPHPPELQSRVSSWSAPQLFYIVKHGIKFTGMPAWPAQERDDEVWAVVAFLRRMPGLDRAAYQALVHGGGTSLPELSAGAIPSAPPDDVARTCARCHGTDGTGRGFGAFPKIAGQRREYLSNAMGAYATGRRHSGIMETIAAGMSNEAREATADYYAALAPALTPAASHDADRQAALARGETIATRGVPEQEIPICVECHTAGDGVNPAYPRLAGQYAVYLEQQLRLLKTRGRGGSEYVHLMHSFVDRLSEAQIADVAAYFAAVQP